MDEYYEWENWQISRWRKVWESGGSEVRDFTVQVALGKIWNSGASGTTQKGGKINFELADA